MAESLDENSYSSLPSKLPTASTTVNVCVLVNNIPLYCEFNDVVKCLEAQPVSLPLSPLSINDVHVVPTQSGGNASSPATKHAVLAVTASNVEAIPRNLQLQDGILSSSNMIPMFQEKATACFTLIHGTEPIMQYLVSQGEKLSVQLEFKGNNVKVRGSCSQVYKFRQYLVNLLTENILALPPSHHAQHNPQAMHTHNAVNPIPEQVPHEGGSNEGAAATGSGSAGDGKTFTGLSKDVLLLMPKVREDCSKNMNFFPEEGKVVVLASSEEEREQCITKFQNSYQEIIKNRQLKSGSLEVPPGFQMENMFDIIEEFDAKYSQCHFSCDEKARVVKIVSMSSRQFDQAKKLLGDRLAGEKWEEKTGKNKGGGKPGKGAMGFKISTKTGSSEVLPLNEDRKLRVKRGNLVEEDVEIIVNAANGQLKHAGGVAYALNKASNELQKLSNNYTKSYGDVPVGGTALTRSGGGKLKCKWVIHAVGPTAREMKSEVTCSELIFKAITNSLIEAQKKNAKSISFPALSTGIFAVDKSLAADAIFQAITKFHYTSSKVLTDIRIVILDEETYSVFAQHLVAIKAAGIEALSSKEEETSFQTAPDHTVSTTSHHQGYGTPTYQGHHGQPAHISYSSAVGGGHSTCSPAFGTEGHPTAGRGISSTATPPPGIHQSPITTQPTGHPPIPPHTAVFTTSSFSTSTTAGGGITLKQPLFKYEGRGGGTIGLGGGTIGLGGGIGRGALTTGGIGTGGNGVGGIGTGTGGTGRGIGGFGAETGGTQGGGFGRGEEGVGQGDIWQVPRGVGGIQGEGFGRGAEGGFGGVGRGGDNWPQQGPGGAVVQKLLTRAEVAQTPPAGITRSVSDDGHYSTPPDSLTHNKGEGGEGATPSSNKADDDKGCSICLNEVATDPVTMKCCSKVFCRLCIDKALKHSSLCPNCRVAVKQVEGNQPPGTMGHDFSQSSLPGYEGAGTIVIKYSIPGGTQTNEHPNPGQRYHGTTRSAYLPNTSEGQEVLRLLKKAFDARLIFTVGTSHTTGTSNSVVWNDIHHKTAIHGDPYGYPDPTYLSRVKEELKAKGIQ